MKMRLISGGVVSGIHPDVYTQEVKTTIDVDLSKHQMEVVDILFQRHPITNMIESSLMILNDGVHIRVVGDIRDNKDIVVRDMGYKI